MSSWTEALVEDIGDLPSQMARNLQELREDDKATRNLSTELTKREADFLAEVKAVIKEHGSTFDESLFQQRGAELTRQRQELSLRLDEQLSRAKRAYEVLDKRIITFDEKTKQVKSLYAYLGTEMDGDARNKKKKRKSRGAEETEVQMNEPTYCFCRAVQYGEMIACDYPDCELEWFHYACVNIKVQVTQVLVATGSFSHPHPHAPTHPPLTNPLYTPSCARFHASPPISGSVRHVGNSWGWIQLRRRRK